MKKIFLMMMTVFAFNTAWGLSLAPSLLQAKVTEFNINQNWLGSPSQGLVQVDKATQELRLTLWSPSPCDADMVCTAVIADYTEIVLPLLSTEVDTCGAIHYTAGVYNTPVDGLEEILTVTDNRAMTCEILVQFMTEVTYRTYNPWMDESAVSWFGANRLEGQVAFPSTVEPVLAH